MRHGGHGKGEVHPVPASFVPDYDGNRLLRAVAIVDDLRARAGGGTRNESRQIIGLVHSLAGEGHDDVATFQPRRIRRTVIDDVCDICPLVGREFFAFLDTLSDALDRDAEPSFLLLRLLIFVSPGQPGRDEDQGRHQQQCVTMYHADLL